MRPQLSSYAIRESPLRRLSSTHATFHLRNGDWVLEDANSRNGTWLNGRRITAAVVSDTDIVEIGRAFLMIRAGSAHPTQDVPDHDAAEIDVPLGLATL